MSLSFAVQSVRRWALAFGLLVLAQNLAAEPVISEFMAANSSTLADEDGAFSDWIELYNPDATPVDLGGWYLTDSLSNKTKWQIPATVVPAGGYIVVFASNKNRTDAAKTLHTNFALSAGGEYLGLIKPDGVTVASEYAPEFPAQLSDVSYGMPQQLGGVFDKPAFLSTPTPGGPNFVTAANALGDAVAFSRAGGPFREPFVLELSGADAGQEIRYVITTANGAPLEPTASSPLYVEPLQITSSVVIRAAVFGAEGKTKGPVSTVHYAKLSPSLATFTSQLPVLVLDTLGSRPLSKDGVDHNAWLYAYQPEANGFSLFNGTPEVASSLTATVRGSSSAEFPKKGYNIKFTDDDGSKRSQSLLGLPDFEKWALIAPWSFDFGYVNNAFVYSLSNQLGRWAPRTRFAELFLNSNGDDIDGSDYAGLYVLTDRVEIAKGRLDIASLSSADVNGDALTGGYLLKIDAIDADEVGWVSQRGVPAAADSAIVLVSPKADEVAPAQLSYIQNYVQRMEDALYNDRASGWAHRTYLDYVDRASWVDHHLLNTFTANPDAFIRSAYFHKDRGGKLAAGPVWDFDRAIGSYWDERSFRWDVWSGVGAPDYWRTGWWGVIAEDPEFMQDWIDRWQSLRRDELSTPQLRALIDSLGSSIGSAAAQRDAARWPDNASNHGSHAAQLNYMKGWITQRAGWIDQQFVAAPTITVSAGALTFTAPAGAQLVYTLDGSDPRSLGGEIAPNAVVTSESLTVNASANVHVRGYRAELRQTFPGSPWSSAVGGEASSPLLPKSRLVNLSSRAIAGSGENALIAGVVVADTEAKRYLSRAIGPGLAAFGASGVVPDPQLSIFAAGGVELFRNNGWADGPDAQQLPSYARAVGAFPLGSGSRDSALANTLTANAYTVQVTAPSGQNGVALAELYELDANGRTVNLSTRAYVRTDEGVLIGGFVVAGAAYKRMLIRAVGPTLGGFGVANALIDPVLTVFSGTKVVATNDRWEAAENPAAVIAASKNAGAFALAAGSQDAAMLLTLPPGAYTLEVKGKAGAEGVALLEIYEVP